MAAGIRFQIWLPLTHAFLGGFFGVLGAWQRVSALNGPGLGGDTLWHSTAIFHFWPWSYKFALSINWPAFLGAALIGSAIAQAPPVAEYTAMALSALLAVPIWRWIGSRLDNSLRSGRIALKSVLGIWLSFNLVCLLGALTLPGPLGLSVVAWIGGAVVLLKFRIATATPLRR